MRFAVAAAALVACIASAALAQDSPPPISEAAAEAAPAPVARQLHWVRQASARHFANAYPSRAAGAGLSGAAVLCCTVLADGRLDCTVPFEWPSGYGFGEATLRIARELQLANGEELEGGRLRRQIAWIMGSRTPELDDVLTRIREGTQNICGPTIDSLEGAADDISVTRH